MFYQPRDIGCNRVDGIVKPGFFFEHESEIFTHPSQPHYLTELHIDGNGVFDGKPDGMRILVGFIREEDPFAIKVPESGAHG